MVNVATLSIGIDSRNAQKGAQEVARAGDTITQSMGRADQSVKKLHNTTTAWFESSKRFGTSGSRGSGRAGGAIGSTLFGDTDRALERRFQDADRAMDRLERSTGRLKRGMGDLGNESGKARRGIFDVETGLDRLNNKLGARFGLAAGVFALGAAFASVVNDARALNAELAGMSRGGQDLSQILDAIKGANASSFAPSREDQIRALMSQQTDLGMAEAWRRAAKYGSDAKNSWRKFAMGLGDFVMGQPMGSGYAEVRARAEADLERQKNAIAQQRDLEAAIKLEQMWLSVLNQGQPTVRERIELEERRAATLRKQVEEIRAAGGGLRGSNAMADRAIEAIDRNERLAVYRITPRGSNRWGPHDPIAELTQGERDAIRARDARPSFINDPNFPYEHYAPGADRYGRRAGMQEAANRFGNLYEEGRRFVDSLANSGSQRLTDFFDQIVSGSVRAKDAIGALARAFTADLMHAFSEVASNRIMAMLFKSMGFGPQAPLVPGPDLGPSTGGGLDLPASVSALGNAFSRGVVTPFSAGGVVGSPLYFPMAYGKTGLMGERYKKEGIFPLTQTSGGELGVKAVGVGGGQTIVNVTIHARDADSFRKSRRQIAEDIRRGVGV